MIITLIIWDSLVILFLAALVLDYVLAVDKISTFLDSKISTDVKELLPPVVGMSVFGALLIFGSLLVDSDTTKTLISALGFAISVLSMGMVGIIFLFTSIGSCMESIRSFFMRRKK